MKLVMCAVTLGLCVSTTSLDAQVSATTRSPFRLPSIWLGSGAVTANNGGPSLATNMGALLTAAVELPMRVTAGRATFALRAESAFTRQSLATNVGSGVSGDVHTLGAGLAVRVAPTESNDAAPRRFTPYVLAGAGFSRPSTRVSVLLNDPDLVSARFSQTSSEVAMTGVGGIGAQFFVGRVLLFAEARRAFARYEAGTMFTSLGTLGVTFQPHR